ncbi:MAG: helix-turn-helix transcriptional regulator [Clostridia bacterium]|nr:helix-turn-helix transcriptional regulator [Clostridia bacterium]
MKFSERLIEVLKTSKYSQKELANMLKISESNISNWKSGKNLPSVDVLYNLCVILEESADYILGLTD